MNAYKGTSVNWAKTQTDIAKMLTSKGIYQTRFTNLEDKFAVEFLVNLPDQQKPVAVRILVPIKETSKNQKKREQELNRLHRVLFYHIKAKFVAIESGLTEFMEEFMPHLIVMDKNGNSTTMGTVLIPQYKKNLESGEQKDFKLLN